MYLIKDVHLLMWATTTERQSAESKVTSVGELDVCMKASFSMLMTPRISVGLEVHFCMQQYTDSDSD